MNIVNNISIECNIQIASILTMTKEKARIKLYGNMGRTKFREFFFPITGVVKIDYPLTNPDYLDIELEHAFGGILWEIANRYKEIYAGEDKTATEVESPNPQLINRGRSNGNYGIWGHDLEDLYFEGLQIFGKEIVILIGS
jgi:hypothetical protein